MKETLNEKEKQVFDALVINARSYNEEGCFCYEEVNYHELGLSLQQMKGYLSSLVKKNYIIAISGSYFSHCLRNFENY